MKACLLLALLVLPGRLPASPGGTPAPPAAGGLRAPAPQEGHLARILRSAATPKQRVRRDALLSFPPAAAARAREELEAGILGDPGGLSALVALGAGGSERDLALLASHATDGTLEERRAAVLGLGELGAAALPALHALAADPPPGLAVHVGLALLRAGGEEEQRLVLAAAEERGSPLRDAGRQLAGYASSGIPPESVPAWEALLDLRWDAARRYGLVDGSAWSALVLDDLLADPGFLSRVVLEAAVRPEPPSLARDPSLADHLLGVALGDGPPERLRAVAEGIPQELGHLIAEEVWQPGGIPEWRVLLDAVEDRHVERRALDLLRAALRFPALEAQAGRLLLRGGEAPPPSWFARRMAGSEEERIELVLALGANGDPARVQDLLQFLGDRQAGPLFAACLVALARIGHAPAVRQLEELLARPTDERVVEVLAMMAREPDSTRILRALETAVLRPGLPPELRLEIELALASRGQLPERTSIRTWLAHTRTDPRRILAVRALARAGSREDLALLERLFPTGEDRELDVELALGLLAYRGPVALRLLRRALWGLGGDAGIVAGGLYAQALGVRALEEELEVPLPGTTVEDQRRVGFSIGRFGGLAAVEDLARRRSGMDPALQGAYLGLLSTRTQ